jgi:hypothetical protein
MGVFDVAASIPSCMTAGEFASWSEALPDYPVASYAVAYQFGSQTPLDGFQQFTVTGTESATALYTFTMPAAPKPGEYRWEKKITRSSDSVYSIVESGVLVIMPNLATAQTTTHAAAQVALLETAIATLNASPNSSVSFNGQSFTRVGIESLKEQLVFWKAEVLSERRKLEKLRQFPAEYGVRFA